MYKIITMTDEEAKEYAVEWMRDIKTRIQVNTKLDISPMELYSQLECLEVLLTIIERSEV